MGDPPLTQWPWLELLKNYMQSRNILNLCDISNSNLDGSWKSWDLPCPNHLERDKEVLIRKLRGKSPISRNAKDSRGWGYKSGCDTTSVGYKLSSNPGNMENLSIWKSIWAVKSLPKIDFFTWNIAQNRILTS